MGTINLAGSDGKNYEFLRHAMGKEAPKAPGLFIFTGSTEEDKETASALYPDNPSSNHSAAALKDYPLYIEQAESLDKDLGGLLTRSPHFEAWQKLHATSAWYCVLDWPTDKRYQAVLDLRQQYPYPITPDS